MQTPQPKVSFKEQMHQAREDAILQSTCQLLGEKAFDAMTMDDVANAVGIAKASLYKHFCSKEELCSAAMVQILGRVQAYLAGLPADMPPPAGTVRLISGCQDDQLSSDGTFNGLFTATLLKVWNNGKFDGDYTAFHGEIIKRMPAIQQPNHFVIGPPAPAFDRQRPFDIAG